MPQRKQAPLGPIAAAPQPQPDHGPQLLEQNLPAIQALQEKIEILKAKGTGPDGQLSPHAAEAIRSFQGLLDQYLQPHMSESITVRPPQVAKRKL
jgi:peptidoglycan hydrolase-like protein with peptidoglycan-binding domain